jgi:hypothetical protein
MRSLYESWIASLPADELDPVEPPPEWVESIKFVSRGVRMEHEMLGKRLVETPEEADALRRRGWHVRLTDQDFSEIVHFQAVYFETRFFPRLRWYTVVPPAGAYFVLGDRPVAWGFASDVGLPPSVFRVPGVQLLAPLTRSLGLLADHQDDTAPSRITPADVNRSVVVAASRWIAGPTEATVSRAMASTRPD